jgi:hypothetical protein
MASESTTLFDCHHVCRRLYHTQRCPLALWISANLTDIKLSEIPTPLAILHLRQGRLDRFRNLLRAIPITL